MRILTVAALLLFVTRPLPAQEPARTNPGTICGDQSKGLPDFYYEAVLARIDPPDWKKSVIRITVGQEEKLALWSDGKTFQVVDGHPRDNSKEHRRFLAGSRSILPAPS